jgi:hypothetical protein
VARHEEDREQLRPGLPPPPEEDDIPVVGPAARPPVEETDDYEVLDEGPAPTHVAPVDEPRDDEEDDLPAEPWVKKKKKKKAERQYTSLWDAPAFVIDIASHQRTLIRGILLELVSLPLGAALFITLLLLKAPGLVLGLSALVFFLYYLVVGIVTTVALVRLVNSIYGGSTGCLLCALMWLLPYVNLFVLIFINLKATAILREHGVRVGLLGADTSRARRSSEGTEPPPRKKKKKKSRPVFGDDERASRDEIRAVARYHKGMLLAIAAQFLILLPLFVVVLMLPGRAQQVGQILVGVVSAGIGIPGSICVLLLAFRLYNVGGMLLLLVASIIPIAGLIGLVMLHRKATDFLQNNGVRVGLFGARLSDI